MIIIIMIIIIMMMIMIIIIAGQGIMESDVLAGNPYGQFLL